MVCPNGVKIAEINARARARMVEDGKIPPLLRLRNNLVARSATLGKIAQPFHPLSNFLFSFSPVRILADRLLHIARQAPFPRYARQRFTSWFRQQPVTPGENGRVVFFHGCATEYYEPWIGKAVVRVLEANGLQVIVPDQNCCGLPLLSNGEFGAARRYHASNVRRLVHFANQGIPILGTSTSCILTLKEEAPELLDMHDEDTRLVASMTYDFSEFMLQLYRQGRLNTGFSRLPIAIPYHEPCQYRAHRLGNPGRELINLVPGVELIMSPAACCGIAGTYGFKSEKYSIAMQVGEPLFDFVRNSTSPFILCESETCRWQITHATSLPAFHPVELLAYAYGLEVDTPLHQILSKNLNSNRKSEENA
jgi:glycerol-3-phosphate dehydrogenase subunit C